MVLEDLFKTEVMRWRYAGMLAVVMALQAVFPRLLCTAFSSIIIHQVWSPVSLAHRLWMGPWLQGLFWPSLCFLALTRLHVHHYKVFSSHPGRVWESLRAMVRLRTLALTCAVCVCVSALVTLYAAAAHDGCSSILQPCHTSVGAQVCINSRALVVLCLGLYLGCRHAANYTLANGSLVTMATVTVPRGRRLRSLLLRPRALLKRAVGAVLGGDGGRGVEDGGVAVVRVGVKSVVVVLVGYALIGGLLEQWVASALGGPVQLGRPSSNTDKHHLLDSVVAMLHSGADYAPLDAPASDAPSVDDALQQSPEVLLNDSHTTADAETGAEQRSFLSMILSWNRFHVLVDPALMVVMVFAVMLVTVMLELFHEVFAVFTLQPIQLPPSPTAPDGSNNPWCLPTALQSEDPALRLLACHRLAQLGVAGGESGRRERATVFEISSPGGHPRNLKAIITPTLDLINKFTERLMKQNCPEEYTAFIASATPSSAAVDGSFNSSLLTGPSGVLANNTTILGNTSAFATGNTLLGNTSAYGGGNNTLLGNTSAYGGGNTSLLGTSALYGNTTLLNTTSGPAPVTAQQPAAEAKTSLAAGLKKKLMDKLIEKTAAARRLPVIRWLLAELPDAANRQIFAEAQPVLWAVQGLSGLVCASLTEDQFGVVQRHLPAIMAALLQLNVAVDKSGRAPLPKRLPSGGQYGGVGVVGGGAAPHHTKLRRGLRLTLRTALYTITDTFKDRITEVSLAPSLKIKMTSYLELMEG